MLQLLQFLKATEKPKSLENQWEKIMNKLNNLMKEKRMININMYISFRPDQGQCKMDA